MATSLLSWFRTARTNQAAPAAQDASPVDVASVIQSGAVSTLFQPIVNLRSGAVLGREALSRGPEPAEHPLHAPSALFAAAERAERLKDLDVLCIRQALGAWARRFNRDQKLFLNLHPLTVADAGVLKVLGGDLLYAYGMTARQVVIEITEQAMAVDRGFFLAAVQHLRSLGFLVAVDDLGAGYSNLALVASLAPNTIKLDRSLVHGLDKDATRRALIETFSAFAHRIDATVVAEGIETAGELRVLCEMGIDFGQGYLLARPAPEPVALAEPVQSLIRRLDGGRAQDPSGITLGDVAFPAPTVQPEEHVASVLRRLEQPGSDGVLVVSGPEGQPRGVVVKYRLYEHLGRQYGFALYAERTVDLVMDQAPIMDEATPLVLAAQSIAARRHDQLDDYVVVTREGRYVGVVSSRRILDRIASIRIDLAKEANPLTGLPGNVQIHAEIERRMRGDGEFTVIYVDIDHFKLFNDQQGFAYGDQIIRLLGDILRDVLLHMGMRDDFLGHIGGDDFVVVAGRSNVEDLCQELHARFERATSGSVDAPSLLAPLPLHDAQDDVASPTVSLAVVSSLDGPFTSVMDLARRAAEIKRLAKQRNA